MAGRMTGKVAVVTGAASGIGRATVDLFIAEGAKVIAADLQEDKGAQIEHEHKDAVRFVRCDVMQEAEIAAAVNAAKSEFGKLDILFNNAGTGGSREMVHPGNKDFIRGDRIERPKGGGGSGSGKGQASDSGEGEDDFVFALSKEEFMQVFFEDLALPNLVRTQLAETPEWKSQRAGYSSDGTPNNLHVVRSMRGALSRRIALGAASRREASGTGYPPRAAVKTKRSRSPPRSAPSGHGTCCPERWGTAFVHARISVRWR